MAILHYKKYLLPTNIEDKVFTKNELTDYMYCDSYLEMLQSKKGIDFYKSSPTDYCLANNATQSEIITTLEGKPVAQQWLRVPYTIDMVEKFSTFGDAMGASVDTNNVMVCPCTRLDIDTIIKHREISDKNFPIRTVKDKNGKVLYYTISFGNFPKNYVGDEKNKELEIRYCTGQVKPTGKKYTSRVNVCGQIEYSDEYEYFGKKYVRVLNKQNLQANFNNGAAVKDGKYSWIEVEPITWKILNWKDMPSSINPAGNGKAEDIKVRSEYGLVVLPFYPIKSHENSIYWQNSTIRGYLNGYNVNSIQENGNKEMSAQSGGDFRGLQNFLQESEVGFVASKLNWKNLKDKTKNNDFIK